MKTRRHQHAPIRSERREWSIDHGRILIDVCRCGAGRHLTLRSGAADSTGWRHPDDETASSFAALAIGDRFWWRDTPDIQHGPRGPEPMRKASADRYEWSRGYGIAEPHYPVWRIEAHGAQP